jgi:hypothetical protein
LKLMGRNIEIPLNRGLVTGDIAATHNNRVTSAYACPRYLVDRPGL